MSRFTVVRIATWSRAQTAYSLLLYEHHPSSSSYTMDPPTAAPESISFINVTTKASTKNSSTKKDSAFLQNGAAKDTLGFSIGPIPPRDFLDSFLPKEPNQTFNRKVRGNLFSSIKPVIVEGSESKLDLESDMYESFVSHHLRDSSRYRRV